MARLQNRFVKPRGAPPSPGKRPIGRPRKEDAEARNPGYPPKRKRTADTTAKENTITISDDDGITEDTPASKRMLRRAKTSNTSQTRSGDARSHATAKIRREVGSSPEIQEHVSSQGFLLEPSDYSCSDDAMR